MNKTTLLIIICVGVFVALVGFIVVVRIFNRKRFKRLQENLKKLNQEKEDMEHDDKLSLPKEENMGTSYEPIIQDTQVEGDKKPIIEDYVPDNEPQFQNMYPKMSEVDFDNEFEDTDNNYSNTYERPKSIKEPEDDFDKFMNEHSYSRKVFNRPLVEKIKKLPPDVRMLLLSNVFDKYDDDKK